MSGRISKAPWTVIRQRGGQIAGFPWVAVVDADQQPVCTVERHAHQGNAFLIGAAPDLLVAARLLIESAPCGAEGDGDACPRCTALRLLRAAVAKAEGRKP